MTQLERWQQSTIAKFLLTSRQHFALERRRRRSPLGRLRRTVLRSLLLVGSVSGLFGSTAYAENNGNRSTEARAERTSPNRPAQASERAAGGAVERMP
jgi:hypothetical protein